MDNNRKDILMIASENDGIAQCKVGGIGDVVRDVPPALAEQGCEVTVVTPSYGYIHNIVENSVSLSPVSFMFAGSEHTVGIYNVPGKNDTPHVRHLVIDHPKFLSYDKENGVYKIYNDDPPEQPFASDALKFALFCTAVAEAIKQDIFGHIDCIHLHDWHAAFLLILRKFHLNYSELQKFRSVFTIHNLALQGIRPFLGNKSSLEIWYPGLNYKKDELVDPRWTDCFNSMATGIRLSDAVHTVSKSYAEEILKPSEKPWHYGGEGLESDLANTKMHGKLFGILNACEYPKNRSDQKRDYHELLKLLQSIIFNWSAKQRNLSSSHFIAYQRLVKLSSNTKKPELILTSVSRIVEQKIFLMKEAGSNGKSALQCILDKLEKKAIFIMLGTGDEEYERFFIQMSSRYENFVFLNGYSTDCANTLYATGDLFLMPSSFEPCGISQMLAMRDGQPCLVHAVGGLKDTVKEKINGFTFDGTSVVEQVDNFVNKCLDAVILKTEQPDSYKQICQNASQERFLWNDTVKQYITDLYKF